MDHEQIEFIHEYFQLDNKIKSKERKLEYIKNEFYSQNFCGVTDFDNTKGIRNRGFNVESNVINYLDYLAVIEKQIRILKRKNKHFKDYLLNLDQGTYLSLKRRYNINTFDLEQIQSLGSDNDLINELLEIEEAIRFEFNTDIELFNEMKIQFSELSNETLESSFEAMLEILGV